MATSSNPFDIAEQQYSQQNPFDVAETQYKQSKPQRFEADFTPGQRVGGQLLARGAERILGFPREAAEFAERLIPEKLITKGAEKIGLGKPVEKGFELAKKFAPYKLLPKEEDVRDFTKTIFKGKLEPKNEWEEKAAETFADFAGLAIPFGGQLKLLRPALTSLGANLAKEVSSELGAPKSVQEMTKLGVLGLSSFIHPKATKNFYNENYEKARQVLPDGATVSSLALENDINQLETIIKKGGISSADRPALQQIRNIRKEMQGAQIPVTSLEALKRKLNIARGDIYNQLQGNKSGIKTAKRNLDSVSRTVDDALKLYGRQDPQWESFYRPANEAFAAEQQSKKAMNFIKRNLKKIGVAHGGSTVLLHHLLGLTGAAVPTGAAIATAGMVKGGELLTKIFKSPNLRKYFLDLIKGATKESLPNVIQSAKKLDEGLKKEKS